MNKLEECRAKIDAIDTEIIKLYEQRMAIVKEVIQYKLDNNIPVLDANRETQMLEKNLKKISNDEFKQYYNDVLLGFLKSSKNMQTEILKLHKNK